MQKPASENNPQPSPAATPEQPGKVEPSLPYPRLGIAGVFMGLANLVPGVSGGTMVLALGLYEEFIDSVANLTRLRLSTRPIIVLGMLFGIGVITIVGLSSTVQWLMEMYLPGMLGLFIGLTLGGVPILHREIRPFRPASTIGAILGVLVMALIAFVLRPETAEVNWLLLFFGGILGSAAMILPGISGSYMLLIFGLYLPIIAGVSEFKDGLKAMDLPLLIDVGLKIILPVGLGVVVGIIALSNVLKLLLARCHKITVGFLLGLLVGSILGLYPFKPASFDKLPRYAVENNEGRRTLNILGYGFAAQPGVSVHDRLTSLNTDNLTVNLIAADENRAPEAADVERARRESAIIIAYDILVSKDVRRLAADESAGEVELIVIANTEYTSAKALLVLILMVIGFFVTFMLGRMGNTAGRKPKPPVPNV